MTDQELIRKTAEFWVANGGDDVGIEWCWQLLRDECKKIIADR